MDYQFNCGNYRAFIVTADTEEQAIERFKREAYPNTWATVGFQFKDVTSIIPIPQEKEGK